MSEAGWSIFREYAATYLVITCGAVIVYVLLCELCRWALRLAQRIETRIQHRRLIRPMSHNSRGDCRRVGPGWWGRF